MNLFSRKLQFQPADPLGDGLAEDIAAEVSDPANLAFQQDIDGQSLVDFWKEVGRSAHNE